MKTTLIQDYLDNLSREQKEKLLKVMRFIEREVEGASVSSVFTLPGFTVEYIPICNIRVNRRDITIRFFQKDVFAVFEDKLGELRHGRCSITFSEPEEIMTVQVKKLLEVTASATKVDASFMRSVRMLDYGFYNSDLLSPKRKAKQKQRENR